MRVGDPVDQVAMFDFLNRVFAREGSKDVAKERLKLVLVHDRASTSPDVLEELKEELIGVISRYMDIDVEGIQVDLTSGKTAALVANIPIKQVKRGSAARR